MKCKSMIAVLAVLAVPAISSAAVVSFTANDSNGSTTSFNGDVGHWSPAGAPSTGNDYVVNGSLYMRSPNTSDYSLTFGGDTLTFSNQGTFLLKGLGSTTLTANYVIDGGIIYQGADGAGSPTIAGTVTALSGGANFASVISAGRNTMTVSAVISGSGPVIINTSNNSWPLTISQGATSVVNFSGVNTYTGNTIVDDGTFNLLDGSSLTFLIGANGVNNQVTGDSAVNFDGGFLFDLSGASTTLNDSWTIVDVDNLTESFGGTFTVDGFADQGGGLWNGSANGADYQFDTATGTLTVIPEPATLSLIAALGGGLLFVRRRFMM